MKVWESQQLNTDSFQINILENATPPPQINNNNNPKQNKNQLTVVWFWKMVFNYWTVCPLTLKVILVPLCFSECIYVYKKPEVSKVFAIIT